MLVESALLRRFEDAVLHGIFTPEPLQSGSGGRPAMGQTRRSASVQTPAHLWAIGVISLLWNSFGCFDYLMTALRDPATMAAMSAPARAYVEALPAWLIAFWAVGVWGSLAGSLLLLARSRHAVTAFAVSLVGLAVSQGYQMLTERPAEMSTTAMAVFTVLIWGALVFFLLYARRMTAARVLR